MITCHSRALASESVAPATPPHTMSDGSPSSDVLDRPCACRLISRTKVALMNSKVTMIILSRSQHPILGPCNNERCSDAGCKQSHLHGHRLPLESFIAAKHQGTPSDLSPQCGRLQAQVLTSKIAASARTSKRRVNRYQKRPGEIKVTAILPLQAILVHHSSEQTARPTCCQNLACDPDRARLPTTAYIAGGGLQISTASTIKHATHHVMLYTPARANTYCCIP